MRNWWYSLALIPLYLVTFRLWYLRESYTENLVIGGVAIALALAGFAVAWRRKYFLNRTEAFAHGLVVTDIVLETFLVGFHEHAGYWCAAAFAGVIGVYRWHLLGRQAQSDAGFTDGTGELAFAPVRVDHRH